MYKEMLDLRTRTNENYSSMRTAFHDPKPVGAILAILVAISSGLLVFTATSQWGVAISNDSFCYLVSAQNFLAGNGFLIPRVGEFTPMTSWPPLYPLALSAASMTSAGLRETARYMGIILIIVNLLLVIRLLKMARISIVGLLCGTAIIAFSPTLLRAYAHAWSEPLFFMLMLLSMLLLAGYVSKPSPIIAILWGLAAGLSCVTRYAGIAIVAAGICSMLCLAEATLRRKLIHITVAILPALIPVSLWLIRNSYLAGNMTNRGIVFRLPTNADIRSVTGDMSCWLLPKGIPYTIRLFVLCVAITAFILLAITFVRRISLRSNPIASLSLIFIICYELLVLFMCLFVDPYVLAEERIQLPILITAVIFVFSDGREIVSGRFHQIAFTLALSLAILCTARAVVWESKAKANGLGYTNRIWAESQVIKHVRTLPPEAPIFSNSPQAIYAQTGRVTWFLPSRTDFTYRPNQRWEQDLEQFKHAWSSHGGYVVVFSGIDPDAYDAIEQDIYSTEVTPENCTIAD